MRVWRLNKHKQATQVEFDTLPDFVQDSLANEMVAVADGNLYANTFEDLLGSEIKREEVTIIGEG